MRRHHNCHLRMRQVDVPAKFVGFLKSAIQTKLNTKINSTKVTKTGTQREAFTLGPMRKLLLGLGLGY